MADRTIRASFSFPLQVKLFRKSAEKYMEMHPDVRIEIPDNKLGTTENNIRELKEGKHPADLLDLHSNFEIPLIWKDDFASLFIDLGSLVKPYMKSFTGWETCTCRGKIIGVPGALSGSVFYYRWDVFEELGIDADSLDTWDKLIEAGHIVKEKTGSYILALDVSGYNQLQPMMLHADGGYFNSEGQLDLVSPGNISTIDLYRRLIFEEEVALPVTAFYSPDMYDLYRSGKVVGAYMPEWYGSNEMMHNLPDMAGKFRIAMAPRFAGSPYRSGGRGGMCAVVPHGPNEDIAMDFLEFARLSKEGQILLLDSFYTAPSDMSVYEDSHVRKFCHPFLSGQNVTPVYEKVAGSIKQLIPGYELMEAQKAVNDYIMPMLRENKMTAGEILETAEKTVLAAAEKGDTSRTREISDLEKGGDVG